MAVPVLVIVGRERTATGTSDDQLLIEAEGLAAIAMRRD
jgi:ATP-dependent Lhr-like helicase